MSIIVNENNEITTLIIEERYGKDFKYEDFTPEQLSELKLTFDDLTQAEKDSLKGADGTSLTYDDLTQSDKDDLFNTYLANFYNPSIIALNSRVVNESATLAAKLHNVQTRLGNETPDLAFIPSVYKEEKAFSVLPSDGSGDFTVDRNCEAYYYEEGVWKKALANEPRITLRGELIIETQSTNLFLNSETLVTQNINVNNDTYTISFDGDGTIDLSGAYTGSVTGSLTERTEITFSASAGVITATVTGNVKFANCEKGNATSYIKTEGATVTRLGDWVKTNYAITDDFSCVLELDTNIDGRYQRLLSFYDTTNSVSLFEIGQWIDGRFRVSSNTGTNDYINKTAGKTLLGFKLTGSEYKLFNNGILVKTGIADNLDLINPTISLGSNYTGDGQINNIIEKFKLYNQAITDDELIELTTP